ncbi:MAG: EpsG family protein, partial [Novosphingobium sp.]
MTVYWLLLAFPAMMAMVFPVVAERHGIRVGQAGALAAFVLAYVLVSLLRHEVGADWFAYTTMYDQARTANVGEGLSITDPLFSALLWLSAQVGAGVYPVNALCSLILVLGVVRVAIGLREPWLAIASAVPYILIVVGFGY